MKRRMSVALYDKNGKMVFADRDVWVEVDSIMRLDSSEVEGYSLNVERRPHLTTFVDTLGILEFR